MEFRTLLLAKEEGVATLILNRPQAMNAIDMEMRRELLKATTALREDEEVKAVILTGAGKAFCAGGDMKSLEGLDPAGRRERLQLIHRALLEWVNLEKPTIAAVNGVAAGAGCSFAAACDIVIASEEAIFIQAFIKVGLVPDSGAMYFLPRLVGLNRAKELFFTGEAITAQEAQGMGLVNRVVPQAELMSEARTLARKLAISPPLALASIKRITNRSLESSLEAILGMEIYAQGLCMQTRNHAEGVRAFVEKRSPKFTGD